MITSLNTNNTPNNLACQAPLAKQAQNLAVLEARQGQITEANSQASQSAFERFKQKVGSDKECGFRGVGNNLFIPLSSHSKAFTNSQWGSEKPTEAIGFYRSRGVVVGGNPSATLLTTLLRNNNEDGFSFCEAKRAEALNSSPRTPHNSTFLDTAQLQENESKIAKFAVSEPDTAKKKHQKPLTTKLEAEICQQ